ncbi:MAG: hypothetical protein AAFV43_05030 [Planctomycetota bacterium]
MSGRAGDRAAAVVCLGFLLSVCPAFAGESIGHVLGDPVYREQVRAEDPQGRHDELHRLFTSAVMKRYRHEHRAELTPTDAELDAARAFFAEQHEKRMVEQRPRLMMELQVLETRLTDEGLSEQQHGRFESQRAAIELRLEPPGDAIAPFVLSQWKWQNYLHKNYGGGRVLLQQFGPEAFDAMREWLEQRERAGDFQITDTELRDAFYAYWTTKDHGSFLSDDPARVQMLLTPYWLQGDEAENEDVP